MSTRNLPFDLGRRWSNPKELLAFAAKLERWLRTKGVRADLASQFASEAAAAALNPAGPPHRYHYFYVYSVARKQYITWLRREETGSRHLEPYLRHADAYEAYTAPADCEIAEERERIATAVAALPPHQRRLIEAHYYEGRTVVEIAADLGVSRQAVHKSMRLAHEALRPRLG